MTDAHGATPRGAPPRPVVLGTPGRSGAHRHPAAGPLRRPPRWREIRLRDRAFIEPFWARSPLTWDARHRRNEWVREVLAARRHVASGRALPCVIDVDGHLAGQCALTAIDTSTATAELGVWIDSRLGRSGVTTVAVGMLVDHAFRRLGVRRVVAPAATDNVAAARASDRAGFHREATLPGWAPTGGHDVVAHDLWALDRDDLGAGGLTTVGLRKTDLTAVAVDIDAMTRPVRGPGAPAPPTRRRRRRDPLRPEPGQGAGAEDGATPHADRPGGDGDRHPTAATRRRDDTLAIRAPEGSRRAVRARPPGAWIDTDDPDVVYDIHTLRAPSDGSRWSG